MKIYSLVGNLLFSQLEDQILRPSVYVKNLLLIDGVQKFKGAFMPQECYYLRIISKGKSKL